MDEKIDSVFSLLGLTKNSKKVFLDLIKHGKSSAFEIAKRSGIHRTNVYDTLRELGAKGLIFEAVEGEKKKFVAMNPGRMTDYVAGIKSEVESIIPYLKDIEKVDTQKESVIMSQGTFAIREALQSLLELKEPINVYGATKEAPENFGIGFMAEFHKKRMSAKILMRHIYHYDATERIKWLSKLKHTEARYLPKKYYSPVMTIVCGDIVLLFIMTQPVSFIKIKNSKIAESYTKYFEILWAKASIVEDSN